MSKEVVCVHKPVLLALANYIYGGPGGTLSETIPALYECAYCKTKWKGEEVPPRVVIAKIEDIGDLIIDA